MWELAFPGRQFAIAAADPDLVSEGQEYLALLNLMRSAPNPDARWFWFAQLMKDKDIASPHQCLPEEVFKRLTRNAGEKFKGFSLTDFIYADLVRAWLPYSEALLADAESVRRENKDPVRELQRFGYEAVPARRATKRWRSAVEFTCEWLADRGGLPLARPRQDPTPARTLRNAYSRVYGSHPRSKKAARSTIQEV